MKTVKKYTCINCKRKLSAGLLETYPRHDRYGTGDVWCQRCATDEYERNQEEDRWDGRWIRVARHEIPHTEWAKYGYAPQYIPETELLTSAIQLLLHINDMQLEGIEARTMFWQRACRAAVNVLKQFPNVPVVGKTHCKKCGRLTPNAELCSSAYCDRFQEEV